jgi:adenylate kinase
MESGGLVSDDIIVGLVKERIEEVDCIDGCLFDGFPRTIPQAQAMVDEQIGIDHVLEIAVSDEEIINRLSGRRVHPGSGRIYHVEYNPPKQAGVDDQTGEALIQRDDDSEQTVRNRLGVYHDQTRPLVNFYRELEGVEYHQLDGVGAVNDITRHIMSVLG